jgi:hypothetical protein
VPSVVDTIEPHRQAVLHFGAVIYKDGAAVPSANTGLLTSRMQFETQSGVQIASGTHVVSIESGLIGELEIQDVVIVDGVRYVNHGPVPGDLAVKHYQVVAEVE